MSWGGAGQCSKSIERVWITRRVVHTTGKNSPVRRITSNDPDTALVSAVAYPAVLLVMPKTSLSWFRVLYLAAGVTDLPLVVYDGMSGCTNGGTWFCGVSCTPCSISDRSG